MEDGKGLKQLIPDITESKYFSLDNESVFCFLRTGPKQDREDGLNMPAFPQLSTVEMTNLVNYIQQRWNSDFEELQIGEADGFKCPENQ